MCDARVESHYYGIFKLYSNIRRLECTVYLYICISRYLQVAVILLKVAAPQLHITRSVFFQNNFIIYFNPHSMYNEIK